MSVSWRDYATGQTRDMPQRELDNLLSPSRLVDSLDDELALYARDSERARADAAAHGRLHEGLRYGDQSDEKIDLLTPAGDGPYPLLVYVHGGFWQQLSRRDSAFAASGIVAQGGAYAAVGYTLAPRATLADIVEQVRRAVAWLWHHAGDYGLDPARIVVAGSSAGAHLAAMIALADWSTHAVPDNVIAGACLISGVYDLDAVRHSYVNAPLGLTDAQVADLSPLRLSSFEPSCRTVLVCGERETEEFKRESRHYAAHLGAAVTYLEIAGRQHFDLPGDLGRPTSYLGHATRDLLGLGAQLRRNG
ncbi:MAG: alpha/beta hydrolase [Gammaproteobacteria bacterium]